MDALPVATSAFKDQVVSNLQPLHHNGDFVEFTKKAYVSSL